MEQVSYDVVVVGAGPAGSIAAYESAKKGFRTLLLEKASIPREKACGGAVMYRGIRIVNGEVPREVIEQKIYGLRFGLHNGSSSEFISDKLIGITVFREKFDEFLSERAAKAGVELLDNARVIRTSVTDDCATIQLQDGRAFTSEFLIGADGVNSIVSRSLGLRPERKDLTKFGLGMEADFYVGSDGVMKATKGNPSVIEILPVENRISYGWMFPKREHLAIGIAGGSTVMRSLRYDFDIFYKNLEKRLGVELKLEKRRTCFIGGDGLNSNNVTDRAILVGDAAGFVDPMMGEGISYAMQSSRIAMSVIEQAVDENRYDIGALSKYHHLCKEEFASNFKMAGWAGTQGIIHAANLLPRINGHKIAADTMSMVARGEIGYADIPYVVLKTLPRQLPSIIKRVVQSHIQAQS
ncbi:MAG: geranylgeranyl reductase family protein [Candidatus Thorarchaeota archaeon]|nr:MAG: geranylgeranyl reductase family protein [Candidatus Thorarchaeota archaeon]